MFLDPDGLNTLDDFYYQKVTNAETQEEKENYIQQQTQAWNGNQGLSEYGKIVETFSDFSTIRFTEENPLNQNDLDKVLSYNKKTGKSTSCMLAAMINAYASLFKSGISGLQIMNALFDGNGNIMNYIGTDIGSDGKYSFFCMNLWDFSFALANSMNARANDFVDYQDSGDTSSVFLQPGNKKFDPIYGNFNPNEFQNMISIATQCTNDMGKYSIRGLVKYTDYMAIKTSQSGHYVFSMNNKIVDSLDPKRKQARDYTPNSYYKLTMQNRY